MINTQYFNYVDNVCYFSYMSFLLNDNMYYMNVLSLFCWSCISKHYLETKLRYFLSGLKYSVYAAYIIFTRLPIYGRNLIFVSSQSKLLTSLLYFCLSLNAITGGLKCLPTYLIYYKYYIVQSLTFVIKFSVPARLFFKALLPCRRDFL